jgi:hypothetical protein
VSEDRKTFELPEHRIKWGLDGDRVCTRGISIGMIDDEPGGDVPCMYCGKPTGVTPAVLKANGKAHAAHYACLPPIDDPGP